MQTLEERGKQIARHNRRILYGEVLIFFLAFSLLVSFFHLLSKSIADGLIFFFSVVGVVPVIWRALKGVLKRKVTIDLLASIAIVATLAHGDYLSAVFINLMLASAELFDLLTQRKTADTISRLLELRPPTARIKEGDSVREVPLSEVKVGDYVVLGSGERVPVDGTVVSGSASLNQAAITGESALAEKTVGSPVFSATLVEAGSLVVKAEKVGNDTTLAKMIALVDEASRAKTKTETIAERFSTWYIIFVLVASAVILYFTHNVTLILGILLVTCADDIAVAIPLGFTVAISKAARHGIVVKGAAVLEKLSGIEVFVTDKTGTLTRGVTKITGITAFGQTSEQEIYAAVSACSSLSKHPVSRAVMKYLVGKGTPHTVPDEVHEQPGFGISAKKNGHEYLQGKTTYLISNGVKIADGEEDRIREVQAKGESVSAVAIDGRLAGFVSFEDALRPYARETIRETRALGVKRWYMLTGDNEFVAERVGKTVGVDKAFANLKPEDKINKIKELKNGGKMVAMVGDGVNDAPALALSDVSFAMGAIGSDAAIEAADIALMHDDFKRIAESMLLSREALRIVKQNFAIWAVSNVVGLSLVAYGVIGPAGAAAYNFLTDFLPIMNVFQIWFLKINKHAYLPFEVKK